ncbi:DUF5686 and carboxypeptidase regulatory-like domain-containing protein [Bacteroidales bacterium OttesenSCG-928-L03]|nr:DUF5686 and carboxypeptidase regulatory-like domain-containing protein [Bacteroidales bacterium OttesenSCG-928-L03]
MKKQCLVLVLFLFVSFPGKIYAQSLTGRVIDKQHNPVPAASVYIRELKQGIISNPDGEFQTKIAPGDYLLEVRSLGYETQELPVRVGTEDVRLSIELASKDFVLPEVQVSQGEDPAYEIIRKTIAKAPYYQTAIRSARYENYVKGSGKLTHIPKLVTSTADEEDKAYITLYKDKLFLQESLTEVSFTAPDKYEKTVKAYSSSMPFMDNPTSALSLGLVSLYYPMMGDRISPLNPKAFSYYKFRYEGYEEEDGQTIFVIRVIPKLKDPKLVEGILYIADEEWNIRYADLTMGGMGTETRYRFNFHAVAGDVYLVTNYEANMKANLMGLKFHVDFLASVQYLEMDLKNSTGEEKPEEPVKEVKKKKSLEIKPEDRSSTVVDSLAVKRDSAYWTEARAVVLNEEELNSYHYKDTLIHKQDSLDNKYINPSFSPSNLLLGGTVGDSTSMMYFRYNGLLSGLVREYNFADGLWMGQSFELDFKKRRNTGLVIKPEVYWRSARRELAYQVDAVFDYAPRRLGKLVLSIGQGSEDYAGPAGMDRFINMDFLFFGGKNYARFYEKEFLSLKNEIDVANGLQLALGAQLSRNTAADIRTNWAFFNKKDKENLSNLPDYPADRLWKDKKSAQLWAHITYTPEYYYRIREGKKYYAHSRFPTFELDVQKGYAPQLGNGLLGRDLYTRLELGVSQTLSLGYFNRLKYKVAAGQFFGDRDFNYIHYKHFDTSKSFITFKSWSESYTLLPYYSFATDDKWLQAFVTYNTDYLLLKRLPFLQGKMMTETLQAKFLYTPDKPYYTEWGYSVNLPQGLGGVGVFVSFDKFEYKAVGFQISIPLFRKIAQGRGVGIEISL